MTRALLLCAALAMASPAVAGNTDRPDCDQFEWSIQHRLNALGMRDVDACNLTRKQRAALHLKLQRIPGFGYPRIRLKQEVKVILGWSEREDS